MFQAGREKSRMGCFRFLIQIPDMIRCFFVNVASGWFPLETSMPFTKSEEERRTGLKFGSRRAIVIVPPHSLGFLKRIKEKAQTSLNAVQLSVFTGALRRYSIDKGCAELLPESAISRTSLPCPRIPDSDLPEADSLRCDFAEISCNLALS